MVTIGELRAQISAMMAQLQALQSGSDIQMDSDFQISSMNTNKDVLNKLIQFFTSEIERIDRIFSDFTSRFGLLIAIAGLLSFLPPLAIKNEAYLTHFLIWTFPFMIASTFTYYPSSLRTQSIIKRIRLVSEGHPEELSLLEERVGYLQILWREYISRYKRVLWWNRVTTLFIYTYILSLSMNFYLFAFDKMPTLNQSRAILVVSLLIPSTMIAWQLIKSKKNQTVGKLKGDIATGAAPIDVKK